MEYVDDKDEIESSLEALDRIKDWAHEQMGSMRRPKPMGEMQPAEAEVAEMNEDPAMGDGMSMGEPEPEMEMPMDAPPPPSYGGSTRPPERPMDVFKPRRMSSGPSPQPSPPPSDDGMKDWTNQTVKKLDKFGKKLPRR